MKFGDMDLHLPSLRTEGGSAGGGFYTDKREKGGGRYFLDSKGSEKGRSLTAEECNDLSG